MITINPSGSVIIYVMTFTNKRLLISESHGDSNRYTPCRGKPDQHDIYASHASPHMPGVCFLWPVPVRGNLSWAINRVEQGHCSWEKGLPTQSTARRLTDPWVRTSFSPKSTNEAVRAKPSIYRLQATRLTGPISPACDRYVQHLLAGANPSILNQHRWGLQPCRCRLAIYHSLTFPTSYLHFPLRAPPGLQFNQVPSTKPKCWVWEPMTAMWSFGHATIYRSLHLCLTIANDSSLVTGVTRIYRKVVVMQLGINSSLIT
jgi:hypothetical protein